jgi:hypothetical protein
VTLKGLGITSISGLKTSPVVKVQMYCTSMVFSAGAGAVK